MRHTWARLLLALWLGLVVPGLALAAIAMSTVSINGVLITRAQLLTDAEATGDGEWIDTSSLALMSVHVSGITIATVEIDGSNDAVKPADNTHGIKLNSIDITADQMIVITAPYRWLKVRVTAYTSGTINAMLEAQGGNR